MLTTVVRFRYTHGTREAPSERGIRQHFFAVLIDARQDVKAPEQSGNVQEQAPLGNMQAGAYSAATSVPIVVPGVWVGGNG